MLPASSLSAISTTFVKYFSNNLVCELDTLAPRVATAGNPIWSSRIASKDDSTTYTVPDDLTLCKLNNILPFGNPGVFLKSFPSIVLATKPRHIPSGECIGTVIESCFSE